MAISERMVAIFEQLPIIWPLFPGAATSGNALAVSPPRPQNIEGISLHSYRYTWAERGKTGGYTERFAQLGLGPNSTAVHRVPTRKGAGDLAAARRI